MRGKSEDNWRVPSREEDSRPREQHMQSHQTQECSISGTFWVFNVGMGEIQLGQPMQSPERSIKELLLYASHIMEEIRPGPAHRRSPQSCCPFPSLLALREKSVSKPQFPDGHRKGVCPNPRPQRLPSNIPPPTRRAILPKHQSVRRSPPFLDPCKPQARAPEGTLVWTLVEGHLLPKVSGRLGVASRHNPDIRGHVGRPVHPPHLSSPRTRRASS